MSTENTISYYQEISESRPPLVRVITVLLGLNAVILLGWWIVIPTDIESKGAQLFFIFLWGTIAYAIYRGHSWVRYAIAVVVVAGLVEIINAQAPNELLKTLSWDEKITKSIGLVAVLLLFYPISHRWYKSVKETRKRYEAAQKLGT